MFLIYVKQSWLSEIGGAAKHILQVQSELDAESNACLIATKVEFDPPFLEAALVGKKDDDRLGLHSFIPLDVVRGMFEISEAEKKRLKIGFS